MINLTRYVNGRGDGRASVVYIDVTLLTRADPTPRTRFRISCLLYDCINYTTI